MTLLALAGAALFPGAAGANTYDVSVCNSSPGQTQNHSWLSYSSSAEVPYGQVCPAPENHLNLSTGLWVRNHQAATWVGSGGLSGWKFTAPSGNSLASITASFWTSRANGSGMYAGMLDDSSLLAGCWPGASTCADIGTNKYFALGGSSEVRVETGCLNPAPGCNNANTNNAYFVLYGATVRVNDLTTPQALPEGAFWTSAWQRGVRRLWISGIDYADGIQETELQIDGHTYGSQTHGCDYTLPTPCVTALSDHWDVDTSDLADGPHEVEAVSYDAARLAGVSPTEPGAPDLEGAHGWRSSNDFSVSWTNPPQGDASPIVAVHYSLCKAGSPATCPVTDQQVAAEGISSLGHIAVPEPGEYLLRVWLEDKVGNVDPQRASDPVHLMYDPTVPGASEPAAHDGWLDAEKAHAVQQQIRLASGARVGPSGIAGYAVTSNGSTPGATINAVGANATTNLGDLPEGRNAIRARAISGAGVAAADADIGATEIDVDKSAPEASVLGAPDPGSWQREAVALTLGASDQAGLSGVRGLEYRMDGGAAQPLPAGGAVQVGVDGRHTVTYRALDNAGNSSLEKTVQFKIDRTAPELVAFEAQDPARPQEIDVAVADQTSGVAGGLVQMRRQGNADWTDLPTQLLADHLAATVNDSNLDAGTYELRARVTDAAGNERISNRRRDGQIELLLAPFRFETRMTAGLVSPVSKPKPRKVSARCRHSKKCMRNVRKRRRAANRRAPQTLPGTVPTLTVGYGKPALVRGTLRSADGQPIAGQPVDVYQQLASTGKPEVRVDTLRTSGDGGFEYHAAKGPSRTIRFQFDGTATLHPASNQVKLLVSAGSTLRVSRRAVANGDSVTFSGRIGQPVVDGLKIIDLQAFYRGRWRTFATPRTDANGAWSYRYRFEATSGVVIYRFRVRVRREASYPYELGYSKATSVTVRGR